MTSVVALLFCHLLSAQYATDTVFTHVSTMPIFGTCASQEADAESKKKCSDRALVQFISRQLVYPEEAKANQTEGVVYVNFVVDEAGKVQSPTLLMDIGSGCGEAALAVVRAMPNWEAGEQDGRPVKVKLNLPVQFSLRNEARTLAERYSITWGDIVGDTVTVEQLHRNLPFSVSVRGPEGNALYVDELSFSTNSRGKRQLTASSRGTINDELVAIVGKAKKGSKFLINATIQDNGRFVAIFREFYVKE
jgi:TonB family protein